MMIAREIRELNARLVILEAFDLERAARPFDMTASRRRRAIEALERTLERERRTYKRSLRATSTDTLPLMRPPNPDELGVAFDAECRKRLQRPDVGDAVVDALEAARVRLDVRRSAILESFLHRGDARRVQRTGGSRGLR